MLKKLAVILFLFMYFPLCAFSDTTDLNKVVLQLRWDHQFQFAGYYAALWKGFYKKEGLDVEIKSALIKEKKILSAPQEVSEGRADFGIGGADILIACDHGADLCVVSVIFQQSAARFYLKETTPYSSLSSLANLRIARKVNDLIDIELQAMLLSEGIAVKNIPTYPHQAGMDHLISGRVQVIPGYKTTIPYYADKLGLKLKEISPASYGVDFYGDTLFTHGNLIKKNPDMVMRFSKASIKGWEYALNHSNEIIDEIVSRLKRVEKIEDVRAFNHFQLGIVKELTLYPIVELGNVNHFRWEKMYKFLKKIGLTQQKSQLNMNTFIFDFQKIQDEKNQKRQIVLMQWLLLAFILLCIILIVFLTNIILLRWQVKKKNKDMLVLNVELEQRVKERTYQLETANKEMEAFSYSVSHDLKAPLRHIKGFVDILNDRAAGVLDEKSKHYLKVISDAADNMGKLINDILSFSRMSRLEMSQSRINMDKLLKEVLNLVQQDAKERLIKWSIGNLPEVYGDYAMLKMVMINLISNAVKFTSKKSEAKIKIGHISDISDEDIFYIKDNGTGFDMKYVNKLFGLFQRLHRVDDFEGTGVGLANIRRIIQRHGGRTWAEGELDKGAIFYFSLPKTKV